MDIVEFFEQSAGRWFSQRTSHHLASQQSKSEHSTIQIEWLPATAPEVIALCQQSHVDPARAGGGLRVVWDGSTGWDQKKAPGMTTVLVPIVDPATPNQGQLLQDRSIAPSETLTGRYVLGQDEALTLITESETMYAEERLWFASENLRMRTSVIKQADGFSIAAFCTEIRMGVAPAAAPASSSSSASVSS